jgi:galactose mutarotase-like enzyme
MAQHGFARRLPWTLLGTTRDSVTLELADGPESRGAWPFAFGHRLEYRLDAGRLVARHEITNRSGEPMPFAFGIHPYLRVPIVAGGDRDACLVRIPRAQRLNPIGRWDGYFEEPFPARELSVAGDFGGTLFLGNLSEPEIRLVDPRARVATVLNWSGTPDLRRVALWSRTPREPYFCIEPWTALPNAFTRSEPGELILLGAGKTWTASWSLDCVASG